LKVPEENMGETLHHLGISSSFLNKTPIAEEIVTIITDKCFLKVGFIALCWG
jgi:hypothetical protein